MKALLLLVSLMVVASNSQGDEIGLFELVNYYEYSPRLASSGQPTRDQLPELLDAGLEAVINLSPANETAAYGNEGELINALGMEYVHNSCRLGKAYDGRPDSIFRSDETVSA